MRSYLVGVLALLVLVVTSLGLALASSSAGGNGPSGAASPGTTTAGRCSKAEATAVVRRLHLGNADFLPNPVGQVLCGAFVGPRGNAMVVSLVRELCLPSLGWAVFRFTGGAWQLVMKRDGFSILGAVGSDIRETVPVWRRGDSPCNPTGGTRARIWHWNGSRLVAGPWRQVTKGKAEPKRPSRFDSPSRNIHCWMFDGSGNYSRGVGCKSDTPPQMVNMNADGRLRIGGIPPAWCGCAEPNFPPLGYGKQLTVGRFRCQSLVIGVRCTVVRFGNGFLINRDGVSRVGS